jgi:hypothetical protein
MAAAHHAHTRTTRRTGLWLAIGLGLAAQALWPTATSAGDLRAERVQPLQNGINHVALQAGTPLGMAMLAHRENFNAHSFDVLTLYALSSPLAGEPAQWQLVPLFDAQGEHLDAKRSGGADCLLHDFRLLLPTGGQGAELVLADREMGDSFTATAGVTFRFFQLRTNREGLVGRPLLYFDFVRARPADAAYCDVGDAFATELQLPANTPP